jgi:hypothetical protein
MVGRQDQPAPVRSAHLLKQACGLRLFVLFALQSKLCTLQKQKGPFRGFVSFAVREGFEPSVQFNPYDGLANRSFRPLRHLTIFCKDGKNKLKILTLKRFIKRQSRHVGRD